MSTLNGDIIISGQDGHDGLPGITPVPAQAPSGNAGTNARCDWDSVCRPNSTSGTPGGNGAAAGGAGSGGDGSNCPSATITIGQLNGTILVTGAAGNGGNGGNGGTGQAGGNGGNGGSASGCPAGSDCQASPGGNAGNGGKGGVGGNGGNGGYGSTITVTYHGGNVLTSSPTPKGGRSGVGGVGGTAGQAGSPGGNPGNGGDSGTGGSTGNDGTPCNILPQQV